MDIDLYKIMYISSATTEMSAEELQSLLTKCRAKNAFFDITGYMIHHEGKIIQWLEGKRSSVEYIYNTIRMDTRHENIVELCMSPIGKRVFSDWQMGFQDINRQQIDTVNSVQDLFEGELTSLELNQFCSRAAEFFETFLKIARMDNYPLLQSRMTML